MSARNRNQSALEAFRSMDRRATRLRRTDFTLTNGVTTHESVVAEYEAPYPLELRDDVPFRLMMGTHEAFFHDGATTAEQTYSLAEDAIETGNTTEIVVYADATQLTRNDSGPNDDEFSYDAANDQITVEVDTDVTIHTLYYAADGLLLKLRKEKPGTTGAVEEVVYDDLSTDLFQRDQHSEPPFMTFNQSAYQPVIPTDWTIAIYQDGDAYAIEWDDSDTDTSGSKTVNDLTFKTPIIDLPVRMASGPVRGLGREVARDIGDRR